MDLQATCARAAELHKRGQAAESEKLYRQVLAAAPDYVPALSLLGVLYSQTGRKDEALALMEKAARLGPDSVPALLNYAVLLTELVRGDEAMAPLARVTALQPDHVMAHLLSGSLFQAANRLPEALASFDRALALRPGNVAAHHNRAAILGGLKRHEESLAGLDRVLALEPDNFAALVSRGYLQWDRFRRYEPAVRDLERAVALNPDHDYIRGDLLHMKMLGGDWRGFDAALALVDEGVRAGKKIIRPFAYQALSESPRDLQACAAIHTADLYPPMPALWKGPPKRREKIRIGYLCGAFGRHALAYLAAGLYEQHDRSRFEVIALDSGRSDNSAIRARLEAAFDKFISIAAMSDDEAARTILAAEIDILVNVDGYSGNARMGVFARRPAPVQVNWLGFPGTLGAVYMDYIIADPVVIPDGDRPYYTEKIVTLPHAYQVNDSRRAIANGIPARASQGLPEMAFVFCNFNQSYKLTPAVFACWMRILHQVPGSVLWMLEANAAFHANLRAEAERQGVAGDRLIFAPVIPIEEHLARLGLADLFLDTLPYNAHTTASDALWAGLPLLTCVGTAFAGRVAASLLKVMDVPELVSADMNEYERLAVRLAQQPALLGDIREKLLTNRAQTPLFDTDLYRKALESAYQAMWANAGQSPREIHLKDV